MREGGSQRSSQANGQWSALLSHLLLPPQSLLPGTEAAQGIVDRVCPAPCPLGVEGEGEGESAAWGGWGEGWGGDGTNQTPKIWTCSSVSPCSSEPQQRLRQRLGEQRQREGEALKETEAAAQGTAGDKGPGRGGSSPGEEGDQAPFGQLGRSSEPPDGPEPVFHQHSANACHFFLCQHRPTCVPQRPMGFQA